MFDTHCHLNEPVFNKILQKAINTARQAGVQYFLIPSTNMESAKKALEISAFYSNIFVALGIHPTEDLETLNLSEVITRLQELAEENEKVLAIGETGLDYYRYSAPSETQKEFFRSHIQLSAKLGLALIVHNRQADDDIIKCLTGLWSPALEQNVVFHCCSPSQHLLDFAIKHKIFIGIDGDITYDKAKQEFVKKIPDNLLVLETDSPYLVPEPLRSQKVFPNEPKNLPVITQFVANLRNQSPEALAKTTTKNATTLFNLPDKGTQTP